MTKPMTIIFLVDTFPSISETFILNQITGLIDLGHKVLIFSASRSTESQCHEDIRTYDLMKKVYYHNEMPENRGKRILWALGMIFVYGLRNPLAVCNALNIFKYGKDAMSLAYLYKVLLFLGVGHADIIFCHFGGNGILGALIKEMGISGKLVTMFHGYDIRRGIENKGLYSQLFKRADALLSISEYNRQNLISFGAPLEKIKHHPVGISIQKYIELPLPSLRFNKGVFKILTVSRLIPEKGLLDGIEVIRRLVYEGGLNNIEYYIIGDGLLRGELTEKVKTLGLEKNVYFLGYQVQQGVSKMLGESHVFFLPSVAEALPVVLMEAQAAGLPVVATDVGSVREVMVHEKSGYCVAAKDVQAMYERLLYLYHHPQIWDEMGKVGRAHIASKYDIKELNTRLSGIFKELVDR